ncbi:hypothetical protein M404DRAFT_897168 [Pisolithus tinctorius Marx 270]|uniref:Uncharacterized protein n=1 Tax=Pisolithus tinctorius Marx 270 TaxID=870435 RepID=A0A0C3N8A5_PISTI|nr:hypothetical protein M404DRAFT_897168 [Pisolithus tinctorius Marx 270]
MVLLSVLTMNFLRSRFKRKKRQSNKSLPSVLFPIRSYTAPIHTWAGAIQLLDESKSCRLRKICHCKVIGIDSMSVHHEFLLVYIRHPSGREAIGRVERETRLPPSVPVLPLSIGNLHSETSNPTHNDHDRISLSYDGTLKSLTQRLDYAQLYTLTYSKPSEAPSAAHLAALLVTISTHGGPTSTTRSTAEHPNAWFAYSVIEVLREIFSGKGKIESTSWCANIKAHGKTFQERWGAPRNACNTTPNHRM